MPHVVGSEHTLMAMCTLLLVLHTAFSSFPKALSPGGCLTLSRCYSLISHVAKLKASHTDRQLITRGSGNYSGHWSPVNGPLRICKDISIFQDYGGANELGIPQYPEQITNKCMSCNPWNIYAFCGSFASAQLVKFNRFKKINCNNCFVNGGRGLRYEEILTFTYGNTKMYFIRLKSANFCRS